MPGRRWSGGPAPGGGGQGGRQDPATSQRTLATVTFQNYFRMYDKLAGMTGTAETEAEEFSKIYEPRGRGGPDQPRHDPRRLRRPGVPQARPAKWNAVIDEIVEEHEKGRPVLVGTISVEVSEMLGEHAEAARHQAQRAERQVPREGGGDRRPGRAVGRGHHRHQHGRPRHRHPARRQPRGAGRRDAAQGRAPTSSRRRRSSTQAALAEAERRSAPRTTSGSSPPAACTSWGPSATRRGGSTTSCAAAPAGRATRAAVRFYLSLEDDLMRRFASRSGAGHHGDARLRRRRRPSSRGW